MNFDIRFAQHPLDPAERTRRLAAVYAFLLSLPDLREKDAKEGEQSTGPDDITSPSKEVH